MNPIETIALSSGSARMEIALRGAEARQWSVNGKPMFWTSDPAVWDEVSPLLFPVVGWTKSSAMRVGPVTYPLGLHGFARHRDFTIEERRSDFVRLSLCDDVRTRSLYPFGFRLEVIYRLTSDSLSAAMIVTNPAPAKLPYACGFHPGFRWPLGGGEQGDYRIRFEHAEAAEVPVFAEGGLVGPQKKRLALHGRELALTPALFAQNALCFLNARSSSLSFIGPEAQLDVSFEGFPHIALWMRPGSPFLCIENWTGHSDPHDFAGDIFDKPSMIILPGGQSRRHLVTYTFQSGTARTG